MSGNFTCITIIAVVEKMKTFYKNKKLDLFKDGVFRLVLKYLMKCTESDFYLFDEEDKVIKEDRKRNILFIKRFYCWWTIDFIN